MRAAFLGVLLTVAVGTGACSESSRGASPEYGACSARCYSQAGCPAASLGDSCATRCVEQFAGRGEACRRALLAFGECAQAVACESIASACAEKQRALESCPLDADGGGGTSGSGGSAGTSGVGGSSASGGVGGSAGSGGVGGASGSAGSGGGGGCARFGLVASGVTCGSSCASVRCDCEPFPRSFSYCTVDGCLITADCAEVCAAASLGDVLGCTSVYTVASGGSGGSAGVGGTGGVAASGGSAGVGGTGGVSGSAGAAGAAAASGTGGMSGGAGAAGFGGAAGQGGVAGAAGTSGGAGTGGAGGLGGAAGSGCIPAECGGRCGVVDDGCGNLLPCGNCAPPWQCGLAAPNECGCPPPGSVTASATVGRSDASAGSVAWANVTAIGAADGGSGTDLSGCATSTLSNAAGSRTSRWLVATGFGLALPPGAEVAGITVRVRRRSRDGEVRDLAVRLVRDGDIQSVDRASPTPWPTAYSEATHGGASDTWGASWSAADVASPGFGVALSAQWNGGSGDDVAGVDHVQVTLSYRYSCN